MSSPETQTIKVGDNLPSIELAELVGDAEAGTMSINQVNMRQLFSGKKGILFAVPGAFTPGCSKTHLPGYVKDHEQLKGKGVEVVACVAVNDVFVMSAWGQSQNASGKVRMLADPAGNFTNAIGLSMESKFLGGLRSQRYSMLVEDGVVKVLNVEPDGKGLTCSLSQNLFSQL